MSGVFNDRRPEAQEAAAKELLRQHDFDKREQHKWGQCDHGCCGRCASGAGDKKTHTRAACAGVGHSGPLGY